MSYFENQPSFCVKTLSSTAFLVLSNQNPGFGPFMESVLKSGCSEAESASNSQRTLTNAIPKDVRDGHCKGKLQYD